MTIWTDLQAAIEAKITALGLTGVLTNLGINTPFETNLQALLQLQAQLYNITTGGGGGAAIAKSNAFQSSATLTRAANTTTYAANDVIFGAFTLPNAGNSAGFVFLTDIQFLMNITYLPSGIGNLRLFLYNVTPPSAVADNSPFSVPSGDRASLLTPQGISLGTPALANGGGSLVLATANINRLIKLSGTSLFGYLVTEGAWIPTANSEVATITAMLVEA